MKKNPIFVQKYLKSQIIPDGAFMEGTPDNPYSVVGETNSKILEHGCEIDIYNYVNKGLYGDFADAGIDVFLRNCKFKGIHRINIYIPKLGVIYNTKLPIFLSMKYDWEKSTDAKKIYISRIKII
jgi:hypothetical protein